MTTITTNIRANSLCPRPCAERHTVHSLVTALPICAAGTFTTAWSREGSHVREGHGEGERGAGTRPQASSLQKPMLLTTELNCPVRSSFLPSFRLSIYLLFFYFHGDAVGREYLNKLTGVEGQKGHTFV